MIFNFVEDSNFQDAFRFGGALTITAESTSEVESLIQHFKLFKDSACVETLKARIAALESGTLSHTIKSTKRPVYNVESCLDYEFIAPYKAWAFKRFGYDGVFPDLEISRKWNGLRYTTYQESLYTQQEHICFNAYVTAEPWAGKDAHTYAESMALDYIGEEFGTRRRESEFIERRNGALYRNPNYLKRHAATPAASNARLKRAFFDWWRANCANAAQLAVIEGNAQIVAETGEYMGAFDFKRDLHTIYYGRASKDYKAMSFDDFATLAA